MRNIRSRLKELTNRVRSPSPRYIYRRPRFILGSPLYRPRTPLIIHHHHPRSPVRPRSPQRQPRVASPRLPRALTPNDADVSTPAIKYRARKFLQKELTDEEARAQREILRQYRR